MTIIRRLPAGAVGLLFQVPAMVMVGGLVLYPALNVLFMSVMGVESSTGAATFVGLSGFRSLARNAEFWQAFRNTLVFTGATVGLHVGVGLALAVMFNTRLNEGYLRISRSLLMLPWTIPPVVTALLWRLLYHPGLSPVPRLFASLGWEVQWNFLGNPKTALAAIVLANAWGSVPFYFLSIFASLRSIPRPFFEAAMIDGAGWWSTFAHVVLPFLRNSLMTMALFSSLFSFTTYDIVYIMTGGGPLGRTELLSTFIYRVAFSQFDFTVASSMGVVMLLAMLATAGLCLFFMDWRQ